MQLGLDRLLALCHPDVGAEDPPRLPRAAVIELHGRYLRNGWWHRSDGFLLLPRRLTTHGMRYPAGSPGPLAHTCVVSGERAEMIAVSRVTQEDDRDGPDAGPLGATDCAVAPLVGADALTLSFDRGADGRWTYGPCLNEAAVGFDLLEKVLVRAETAGVAVLVLPEYCSSPELRARWSAVLGARPTRAVRWIVTGSGPTVNDSDANVATLVSDDGSLVVEQPKVQPYDLRPHGLESWECPSMPAAAKTEPIQERAREHRTWNIIECNRGRLAIAICESFRPEIAGTSVAALGAAIPTLLLCPVFSQPPDISKWERPSSDRWGDVGTNVVVANSLTVAEWKARAGSGALGDTVACGAVRALDESRKGHGWTVLCVPSSLSATGTLPEVARIAVDSPGSIWPPNPGA